MRRPIWLIPTFLAAVLYLPALSGERVWDDSIVLDGQIPAFRTVADVWFPPPKIPQWPYGYYRPLLTISYLVDGAMFGAASKRGPHATVVLLHVASTFFVTLLTALGLRGFRYRRWGAVFGGAVFASHPIHTETVCWITGRSDALAAAFLFPALLCTVHYRDHRSSWALWVSPLSLLLAMLSKEVALAGLALVPLWLVLVPEEGVGALAGASRPTWAALVATLRPCRLLLALHGVATAGYLGLRTIAHHEGSDVLTIVGHLGRLTSRSSAALAYYSCKILMPAPQSALVTKLPSLAYTFPVLAVVVVAAAWALRRARSGQPVWLLAFLSFGIGLLPALPVAVTTLAEAPVAERYLYVPSLGLSVAAGALLAGALALPRRRRWTALTATAIILVAAIGTTLRSRVWKDDISLWTATLEREPRSGLAWGELGKAYLDRGTDLERALECYRKSVAVDNDASGRAIAYNSIGVIEARRGHDEEAAAAWRKSLAERDGYASAHYNLGNLLARKVEAEARRGDIDLPLLAEAKRHFSRAVELDPRYVKAWLRIVWCDAHRAVYLAVVGSGAQAAREALAEAEVARDVVRRLEGEGPSIREAESLVRQARRRLGLP